MRANAASISFCISSTVRRCSAPSRQNAEARLDGWKFNPALTASLTVNRALGDYYRDLSANYVDYKNG